MTSRSSTRYPSDSRLAKMGHAHLGWSTISLRSSAYKPQLYTENGMEYFCPLNREEREKIANIMQEANKLKAKENARKLAIIKKHVNIVSQAYGNGQTSCLVCGASKTNYGRFNLSPTPLAKKLMECHDCKKKVCLRCKATYKLKEGAVLLCKTCTSSREMWKLTGAWFDGYLPNLDHACDSTVAQDEAVSPQVSQTLACMLVEREVIGESETDCSSCTSEEAFSEIKKKRFIEWRQNPLFHNRTISTASSISITVVPPTPKKYHSCPMGVLESSEARECDSISHSDCSTDLRVNQGKSENTSNFPRVSSPMVERLRYNSFDSSSDTLQKTGWSKRASLKGKSSSSIISSMPNDSEDTQKDKELHSLKSHQKCQTTSRPRRFSFTSEKTYGLTSFNFVRTLPLSRPFGRRKSLSSDPKSYGTVSFTMMYDELDLSLQIQLINCKELRSADSNGLSDPYVVLYLSHALKHTRRCTNTVRANLSPVFNEYIIYSNIDRKILRHSDLILLVYDYDMISSDDFLGSTTIPLRRCLHSEKMSFELPLKSDYPDIVHDVSNNSSSGQILVSMIHCTEDKVLRVNVLKVIRLSLISGSNSTNPYVKIYLLNGKNVEIKVKTQVQFDNFNPEFNQEFAIPVKSDVQTYSLKLAVWNYNRRKRNTCIGSAVLKMDTVQSNPFTSALETPNTTFKDWLMLTFH